MNKSAHYAATEKVILIQDTKDWFRGFIIGFAFGVALLVLVYEGSKIW